MVSFRTGVSYSIFDIPFRKVLKMIHEYPSIHFGFNIHKRCAIWFLNGRFLYGLTLLIDTGAIPPFTLRSKFLLVPARTL